MFLPLIDEQNDWQLHSSKSKIHHSYLMCRSKDFIQVAMSYNSAFKRLFSDLWTVYAWYLVLYKVYIYIYIYARDKRNDKWSVLCITWAALYINYTRNTKRESLEQRNSFKWKSELNNGTRHKQMNLHECLLTLFALMKWELNADSVTLKP